MTDSPQKKHKKRLGFILRLVLTLGLIGLLCGYFIEFHDQLLLKDGKVLKGRVLSHNDDTLTFRDVQGNEKKYSKKDEISSGIRLKKDREIIVGTLGKGAARSRELLVAGKSYPLNQVADIFDESGVVNGFITNFTTLDYRYVIIALLIMTVCAIIGAWRWQLLAGCRGVHFSLFEAIKLNYIGLFFNSFLVGITGGDLVRAYYVYQRSKQRAVGVMSVFIDRVIGLFALTLLGGVCVLTRLEFPDFQRLAMVIYGLILVGVIGGIIYFSHRLRRMFRLDTLIKKLPFSDKFEAVDQALFNYRYQVKTIVVSMLMSLVIHLLVIFMYYSIATTLAARDLYFLDFLALMPLVFLVSAIPASISGWGLGDFACAFFLSMAGMTPTQAISLSVLLRLLNYVGSLPGGVAVLAGVSTPSADKMEAEMEENAGPATTA